MLDHNSFTNSSAEDLTRRDWFARSARQMLGVTCGGALASSGIAASSQALGAGLAQPSGKAKSVIYLYMTGAMSHLDTLDPKPGTASQGKTTTAATRLPGVHITDQMPKLAYLMNGIALVRSMTTQTGAHEQGEYLMRTSYNPLNSIRHPALGAWANHVVGNSNSKLPGNVVIGNMSEHPGSGFLPAALAPVPISNPKAGLQNTTSPKYLSEDQFRKRMALSRAFDSKFKATHESSMINAYDQTYREAVQLMGSSELKAFDISNESEKVRKFYGDNRLGQGCLLARRLVERGVKFVEVEYGGWDHHNDIYQDLPKRVTTLDDAAGALLRDLASRGMLDEVLVVLGTEFGRSPKINENSGRDHHPGVFSCFLCGAGIRGGGVYGCSDSLGHSVDENPVYPADLNATIASAMGLPLEDEFIAPNGRPFKICNDGTPISDILA